MSSIERSIDLQLAVRAFESQPEHSRYARDATIRNAHDQLGSAVTLALPHPGGADSVSKSTAQAIETPRIDLVVAREIGSLGPQRPVVSSQIECMQHVILQHVDAPGIQRQLRGVVLAKISVLKYGRRPRSTVRQLVNLNRLLDNDAVGPQPSARLDGHRKNSAIANMADVRLCVDGEGRLAPRPQLP